MRNAFALSFIEKYCSTLIHFSATLVLARLLSPDDFGLFSLGAVIIGFAQMIRDFGVSQYLIQEKELTKSRTGTAFTISLSIGWLIAFIFLLFKGHLADFYNDDRVGSIIAILTISLFILPFNSIILALLRRNMLFGNLLVINIISAAVHASTSIGLALLGTGYESLAWGGVASSTATLIVGMVGKPPGLTFYPSSREFKRVFRFGITLSSSSLLNSLGEGAADLSISKNLNFESLGLYSRALGLASLFNRVITSAIQPVMLPLFSQSIRTGKEINDDYLRAVNYFTLLSWSFYSFVFIMSDPLIRVLYGEQWDSAAPVVKILCVAFSIYALSMFAGPALVSMGMVNRNLKISLICQPIRIALTIWASFYSIQMVAIVQVIYFVMIAFSSHLLLHKEIDVTLLDILKVTYKNFFVACFGVIISYTFSYLIGSDSNILHLSLTAFGWVLGVVFGVFIIAHEIKFELKRFLISRALWRNFRN